MTVTLTDLTGVTVTVAGRPTLPIPSTGFDKAFRIENLPLAPGENRLPVVAVDAVGNRTETVLTLNRAEIPPLTLTVALPNEGDLLNRRTVFVSGGVTGDNPTVTANGITLTVRNGGFFGEIPAVEGTNRIVFQAQDRFHKPIEVVRTVSVDTIAPVIAEVTPRDRTVVAARTTTVRGVVLGEFSVVSVKVDTIEAVLDSPTIGQRRPFHADNVPLFETDQNFIHIQATDAAGNTSEVVVQLTGKDLTPPAAPVLFPFVSPTRLTFQTIEGRAEPDTTVTISNGSTSVTAPAVFPTGLFFAQVNVVPGENRFTVTTSDRDGNQSPSAQAIVVSDPSLSPPPTAQAWQINGTGVKAQRGLIDMHLPRPFIAFVTDTAGNPVAGVPVTFRVMHGGGVFDGDKSDTLTDVTDTSGYARAHYICGPNPGVHIVQASFPGNTATPAVFLADVIQPSINGATTRVSGVVLDQNLRALPNVIVRLAGMQVRTGQDGRFMLDQVPSGPGQHLELIGRDQVPFPGRWPDLAYEIDVLRGIDNRALRPYFLPRVNEGIELPLDANNVVTQETTYELPVVGGLPPIKATVRAGTKLIFPPDVTDKRFSVTRIPVNRVPMSLEDGRATNLYVSVQPSGTVFDPPVDIEFPNLDNQPPNALVMLQSFSHAIGRYVPVGTGRVSADGRTVKNETGGIFVGAWHGFPPPPPDPESDGNGGPLDGDPNNPPDPQDCSVQFCDVPGIPFGGGYYRGRVPARYGQCKFEATCKDCSEESRPGFGPKQSGDPVCGRVTSVVFEPMNNDPNYGDVDANPTDNGGGMRVFPDAMNSGGQPRRKVRVRINVNRTEQCEVYLRSFDVRDSSRLFDTEWNQGNTDNQDRRSDNIPVYGAFEVDGRRTVTRVIPVTITGGQKTVDFLMTVQPGDNFKIVAGTNEAYVGNLSVNNQTIEYQGASLDDRAISSELLTVWRRLYVEVDTMGRPPNISVENVSAFNRNFIRARITSITDDGRRYFFEDSGTPLPVDNSPNLSGQGASQKNGRFENGRLAVGSGPGSNVFTIRGSGNDFLQTNSRLDFELVDRTNQNRITGDIRGLLNNTFTLNRTTGSADYSAGVLTVSGTGFPVLSNNDRLVTVGPNVPILNIALLPATLTDDDTAQYPFLVNPPVGSQANTFFNLMQRSDQSSQNIFAPLYILPIYYAEATGEGIFKPHLQFAATIANDVDFTQSHSSTDNYWVAYVKGGFQESTYNTTKGPVEGDHDPDDETEVRTTRPDGTVEIRRRHVFAGTIGDEDNTTYTLKNTHGTLVFSETINEYVNWITAANIQMQASTVWEYSIPHEIGHQFGLDHYDLDNPNPLTTDKTMIGIMSSFSFNPQMRNVNFIDSHRKFIRKTLKPRTGSPVR